jgi:prepilin-type N-terminal cleavage/methylation domain-containing protein
MMKHRYKRSDQKGFTLVELVSIMIIMGVLASVATKKFELLSDTAAARALIDGVKELNARETLVWTQIKLSPQGWTNDDDLFAAIDKNLGNEYQWTDGPQPIGGTLAYKSESVVLNRVASTASSMGTWQ